MSVHDGFREFRKQLCCCSSQHVDAFDVEDHRPQNNSSMSANRKPHGHGSRERAWAVDTLHLREALIQTGWGDLISGCEGLLIPANRAWPELGETAGEEMKATSLPSANILSTPIQ